MVDAGVCEPFESQPVAANNRSRILLNKIEEVKSAEFLLKPFTSELAKDRPTVDHSMAMTWSSSVQTNGRSAL